MTARKNPKSVCLVCLAEFRSKNALGVAYLCHRCAKSFEKVDFDQLSVIAWASERARRAERSAWERGFRDGRLREENKR
jgi:transposase-like protein